MENTISIINDRIERAKEQIMFDMTKNKGGFKWIGCVQGAVGILIGQ